MKKTMVCILFLVSFALFTMPVSAETEVQFVIDGKPYVTPAGEPEPYINADHRTMVPIRFFADALSVSSEQIAWDQMLQRVTLVKGDRTVKIRLGKTYIYVNDVGVKMDTEAEMKEGRVFIPARFVAEALGARMDWEQATNTISMTTDADLPLPEPRIPTVVVDGIKMLGELDPTGETPDPWGRKVRTTDLPENAEDFLYILEGVPNEMYAPFNQRYFPDNKSLTAVEASEKYPALYDRQYADEWLKKVHNYYDMILNVDYRTIGDSEEWAKQIFAYRNQMVNHQYTINQYKEYADYVKENRIIIEGDFILEPTILRYYHSFIIKAYVNLEILHSDTNKGIVAWEKDDIPIEIGKRYYGVAQIEMGNVSSSVNAGDIRAGNLTSLFEFADYEVEEE